MYIKESSWKARDVTAVSVIYGSFLINSVKILEVQASTKHAQRSD